MMRIKFVRLKPMTVLSHFDLDGLAKAFLTHDRRERECFLDTLTGTVHFIPVAFLEAAEKGSLSHKGLSRQDKERAEIAEKYMDDIAGRFELVPFVEPAVVGEWKADFLRTRNLEVLGPADELPWEGYLRDRLREEAEFWLESTGMLDDDEDAESWDEEE